MLHFNVTCSQKHNELILFNHFNFSFSFFLRALYIAWCAGGSGAGVPTLHEPQGVLQTTVIIIITEPHQPRIPHRYAQCVYVQRSTRERSNKRICWSWIPFSKLLTNFPSRQTFKKIPAQPDRHGFHLLQSRGERGVFSTQLSSGVPLLPGPSLARPPGHVSPLQPWFPPRHVPAKAPSPRVTAHIAFSPRAARFGFAQCSASQQPSSGRAKTSIAGRTLCTSGLPESLGFLDLQFSKKQPTKNKSGGPACISA